MSWVTDVLVVCSLEERFATGDFTPGSCPLPIAALNDWLRKQNHGELICLDVHATGGGKVFQAVVYGAAFNHFPVKEFISMVKDQHWVAPESVQVLTKEEESACFSMHALEGLGL